MPLFREIPDKDRYGVDCPDGAQHKCAIGPAPIFRVTLDEEKAVWALFYELAFAKVVDGELDEEIHVGSMRIQFCPWCGQDLLFTPDQAKEFHERLKAQAPSVSALPEGAELAEWVDREVKVRVGSGRSAIHMEAANYLRKPREEK